MTTRKSVTVINKKGLHARPSALVSETAKRFTSEISISNGLTVANAKSICSALQLCAHQGTMLEIVATGSDEALAVHSLCELFNESFLELE